LSIAVQTVLFAHARPTVRRALIDRSATTVVAEVGPRTVTWGDAADQAMATEVLRRSLAPNLTGNALFETYAYKATALPEAVEQRQRAGLAGGGAQNQYVTQTP
jgi:hypothetical protein